MVFVLARSGGSSLYKVASRFIQGPVAVRKTMGINSSSRSYSPNSEQGPSGLGGTVQVQQRDKISRVESSSDFIESVVCNANDLQDNEMKVFDIGADEGKVLVVRQNGEFSALGTKCTHYGAPLVNGALGDGRIRCPWHGACFNLKTGDIEDFPGFDSLPCYQVTVTEKGEVKVRAKASDLKTNKRTKDVNLSNTANDQSVVIVGGGPSGATCAETLRAEGFTGKVTIVTKEPYLPYDRIKVSKIGTVTDIEKLQVRTIDYYKNSKIDVIKGTEVTKVNPNENKVHLSNNTTLPYTSLYLATGSKARVPDIPGINLKNVFTVRNFEDSINILNTLGENKDKDVVVLGLSFIGLESAASCNEKAKSMSVVGMDTAPLGLVFGEDIGRSLQRLFESKGVKFHFNTTIVKCNGENGVIKSVELKDSTTLPADVLILGVGATVNTAFLKDTGLTMNSYGAIDVNEKMQTNLMNVYAGGDIANAPVFASGGNKASIGHVGLAQYHGRVAALNILKKDTPLRTVPYFWTMLFGKSIRYAGYGKPASNLIDGDVNELKFVIFFFDESDKVISIASCMRDPVVSQFAEYLHQGKSLYKSDLENDRFAWTKNIH